MRPDQPRLRWGRGFCEFLWSHKCGAMRKPAGTLKYTKKITRHVRARITTYQRYYYVGGWITETFRQANEGEADLIPFRVVFSLLLLVRSSRFVFLFFMLALAQICHRGRHFRRLMTDGNCQQLQFTCCDANERFWCRTISVIHP